MDFSFIEDEALRAKAVEEYNASKAEMENKFNGMLQEATTGLKSKNDELLAEKKKLQERFKGITNPEDALEALKFITENEDVRMIKEGRLDEVIERRTSTLKSDYEAKIGELSSTLETERKKGQQYESLFKTKMVEDALRDAALAAKVRPTAVKDIVLRGMGVFALSEDNTTIEARDGRGKLLKTADEKILNPILWIEGLKTEAPHFWPDSESARFDSNSGDAEDLERKIRAAADKNDTKEYRRLRALQRGGR